MKEKPQKKPSIKTAMRIPADLHAELQDAAAREDHSMNTEIVARLAAGAGGASLATVIAQNRELLEQNSNLQAEVKHIKELVQHIVDALGPRR